MLFSADQTRAWYAVQTAYRCEQRVAMGLTNKGIEVYLPLLREVHQWKDRRKIIDVPAFSGYLFASAVRSRVQLLETRGVVRLVGGNQTPSLVSDVEIDAVRRAISSGLACGRCDEFKPGILVRVVRGPLAGIQGRLARVRNRVRLVIAISVFSQAISAEVDQADIEAVEEYPETYWSQYG